MPRIPTAQNQYEARALPQVDRARLVDNRSEVAANVAANVSDIAFKIETQERNKADQAAFMEADRATDLVSNDLYNKAQQRQLKDAIGVAPETLSEFDKQSGEILKGLKTPRQKSVYQASVNQSRANLQRSVDSHERQQTEQYYESERRSYAEQSHQNAVTFYTNPERVEQEIEKQRSVVNQTPGMSVEMKAGAAAKLASATYSDVIDRYLANNQVGGAEAYYKAVKQNVTGEAATHIENSLRVTRDRLASHARALTDKREATAERALNAIDQQIASGVPATSDMWKQWGETVQGTQVADEFKARQADEAEVQGVLRKPIQEQITFLQDKESSLKSGGGSIRQLANFNRLKTAVQQNVKLLGDAPLQFNAVRTGADVEPLNISGIASGDEDAKIQDRLNTLQGMRKQYGDVALKVLLPQESAQLSSVLGSVPPQKQSEVFGGLYNSLGSDAYKVAMQQIAPDSPVRAIAGMLAGRQADMTLQTHWFKPNEIAHSGDVATTMLQGEEILNASKADKAQDGKPKLQLYLPETNTLQMDFQNQVGNAFAGRPGAAEVAFQAVKAYYVGRAVQTGRLASSNADIDTKLVKESITAALGTVVSYNDSDVLAPWGMDRNDFIDKADAALKALGKDERTRAALESASLKNAGDGTYYVTQGRSYMTGANGKPLLIAIK